MRIMGFFCLFFVICNTVSGIDLSWDFSRNGNGKDWQVSKKLEAIRKDDGLYLHGVASQGIEIDLKDGLNADVFNLFNYGISAAEYGGGWLYFAREGEDFSKERRIRVPVRGFNVIFENSVDCSKNRFWKGKIKKLRFTPIPRELDNATLRYIFFSDKSGSMLSNGSFETLAYNDAKTAQNWNIVSGSAKINNAAYAGKNALHINKDSAVENVFELIKEYDFSLSLAHKLADGGRVTLVFNDIFDKKISETFFDLPGSRDWKIFNKKITPPQGTAYVKLQLAGEGDFDAVRAESIEPESEKYRWWNSSKWIWNRDEFNSAAKPVYFRKVFTVGDTKLVKSMKMQIATRNLGAPPPCDKLTVYINGRKIAPAAELMKWNWVSIFELAPYLKNGKNLIAFEVVNNMAPGGVNVDILLENSDRTNRFMRFGSNETWQSSVVFEKGWNTLDFNSGKFKKSRVRGQATPGSFARLPYRFLGNAGSIELKNIVFPDKIAVDRKYNVSADFVLNAEPGFEDITGDAALYFHLINDKKDVISKFKVLPLTEDMLKKGRGKIKFAFDPQFMLKGKYTLRIYADRLALGNAPAGYRLNKIVNFIERSVTVVNQRKAPLADCRITGHEEVPRIVVNDREFSALRFSHGAHTQNVTEKSFNIADKAYNSETRLMDVHISGTWQYREDGSCDFSGYDTFFTSFLARHPDTYFTIHWQLDTAGEKGPMRNWMLQNLSEAAVDSKGSKRSGTYSGSHVVPSMASKLWQNEICRVAEQFVKHIMNSPYADRIIGLMPSCGISYEWIYWGAQTKSFMDYSLPFQNGFRDFVRNKYKNITALNKAWNRNFTSWNQVSVPSEAERKNRRYRDFLLQEENQAVSDMRIYLNTTVAEAINKVVSAVKKASDGKMLAGVYYGYCLYFCGPYFAPFSGHFALGKVLDNPDLDFLISPCRYDDRAAGGAAGSMLPLASLRKHRKLYVNEADNRLVHSWSPDGRITDLRGSKSVMEREFAFSLATGSGLEWLDFGEGWVPEDKRLVKVFENCQRAARELAEENKFKPDYENAIAVVVDEKAIARVAYDQRLFLNLVGLYPNLLRSGTAVHWYLLDDLDKLESYKMIIFTPTVTEFTPEQEKFINSRLKNKNRTLVYLYSTGIYRNGKFAIDNVGKHLDMPVKYQQHFSKRVLRKNNVQDAVLRDLPPYYSFAFAEPTEFFIYPEPGKGDKVLFYLANSKLPGMVKRELKDHKIIYSSSPGLSSMVIQNIALDAGINIFNSYAGDVTYGADGFYAVYSLNGGKRIFNVGNDVKSVKEMLTNKVYDVVNGKFEYNMKKHSTAMFRLIK